MQAIQTYLLPITDKCLDTRIRATCAAKSITVYCLDNLNVEENHIYAAKELIKVLKWDDVKIHTGVLEDGSFVHVLESTK